MLEQIVYEIRPFLYLLLAIFAPRYSSTILMLFSASLLTISMGLVLWWRIQYRLADSR